MFEQLVPQFSGTGAVTIDDLFDGVSRFCEINDSFAEKQVCIAHARCTGTAKAALSGKTFTTVEELRAILEANFGRSEEEHYYALTKVKQSHGESVAAYSNRVRLLFERSKLTVQPLLRDAFMQGLLPRYALQRLRLVPRNI